MAKKRPRDLKTTLSGKTGTNTRPSLRPKRPRLLSQSTGIFRFFQKSANAIFGGQKPSKMPQFLGPEPKNGQKIVPERGRKPDFGTPPGPLLGTSQDLARPGQILARSWPDLARSWPDLARPGQTWPDLDPDLARPGQTWPDLATSWPDPGHTWPDLGQTWPKVWLACQACLGICWLVLAVGS